MRAKRMQAGRSHGRSERGAWRMQGGRTDTNRVAFSLCQSTIQAH